MKPEISLIVLSYNHWEITLRCLASLLDSLDGFHLERGVEILVVDNGSDGETRRRLGDFGGRPLPQGAELRFLLLEENLGYPGGVNAGLAEARGMIVGVLNNDLVFPSGWLTPLIRVLEEDKLVGFAAPFLSYAPSVQNIQKKFGSMEEMQSFADKFTKSNAAKLLITDRVIGACLLFRRDLLDTIGGNDIWYGLGNFDDDDWCLRACIAGYKIAVVGGSFVDHIGHFTFRTVPEWHQASMQANSEKFARKWNLKHEKNPAGAFVREDAAGQTRYDRGQIYIPLRTGDYSSAGFSTAILPADANRRWLICADWNNTFSEWSKALSCLLLMGEQAELCFWVPARLFDADAVMAEIKRVLNVPQADFQSQGIAFSVFQNDLPCVERLRLLKSADAVVKIPGDFVNRNICRLALECGVNIVEPIAQ